MFPGVQGDAGQEGKEEKALQSLLENM